MSTIICKISDYPLNPLDLFKHTQSRGHGAQNFFLGAVREVNAGKQVVAVEYDAHPVLAEAVLKEIALEAQQKWGMDLVIFVQHRVGHLSVGELSVAIGVSSTHRDESYQASRYIIEQIKVRVPIWKKEIYVDGETEWLKGHALCQHTHAAHEDV